MTKTELFAEYPSHHADRRDRARHTVGIPAIVLPIAVLISYAAIDPAAP